MPTTWLPDPSHYPEQMTALSATTWFEAVGRGLHEAMRRLRGPFGGLDARTESGWAYEGQLAIEWEPDEGSLREAAFGLSTRWDSEYAPRVHQITSAIHRMRPEQPAPEEAAELLDRMWELMLEQWTIHFLVVVPAQIAIEAFTDAYIEALGVEDALAPYRLLDGLQNESVEADIQLWSLATRAKVLGVADVLFEYPPAAALDRLRELRDGRLFLAGLDRYLDRFGGRSRWHEVSLPREAEYPEMTLEGIRLFLRSSEAPSLAHADEAGRLEAAMLARAPGVKDVLTAAKTGYALKESHVYHIDYPGLLAVREVALGFGRRLTAEGRLVSPDEVWMLRRDELREAVAERWPSARVKALVDGRRDELAKGLEEGPRPYLGVAPAEDQPHAALQKFYGRPVGAASERTLRGTGASAGVAEGLARVVTGPADFARVHPGDVLVTRTTTPAWTPLFPSLAGLVTETGGILSHAAIVAREYGLPAVVGIEEATRLIGDGRKVRLDGASGLVEIVP